MTQLRRLNRQRKRRAYRVSNRVRRDSTRPRLTVFRSNLHIYAQIVDDEQARTLVSASSRDRDLREQVGYGGNVAAAARVGQALAAKARAAGITQVAFDRGAYKYHGRVAALADAVRDGGLDLGAKAEKVEKPAKQPEKAAKGGGKKKDEQAAKGGSKQKKA